MLKIGPTLLAWATNYRLKILLKHYHLGSSASNNPEYFCLVQLALTDTTSCDWNFFVFIRNQKLFENNSSSDWYFYISRWKFLTYLVLEIVDEGVDDVELFDWNLEERSWATNGIWFAKKSPFMSLIQTRCSVCYGFRLTRQDYFRITFDHF